MISTMLAMTIKISYLFDPLLMKKVKGPNAMHLMSISAVITIVKRTFSCSHNLIQPRSIGYESVS